MRLITIGERTLTVPAWARERGLSATTIHTRLRYGWSDQDAVNRPKQPGSRSGAAPDRGCPYPRCGPAGPSALPLRNCRARRRGECALPATNADRERQRIVKRRARAKAADESASFAPLPDHHEEEE